MIRMSIQSDRVFESYAERVPVNATRLAWTLVKEQESVADNGFRSAPYDGTNDVSVNVTINQKPNRSTATLLANGNAAAFIEFGTGVYYNGEGGSYPEPLPNGIVGIGEYGHHRGRNDWWLYRGDPGTNGAPSTRVPGLNITHGNPASMPMYNAFQNMVNRVITTARRIFGHDG